MVYIVVKGFTGLYGGLHGCIGDYSAVYGSTWLHIGLHGCIDV